MGIKSAWRSEVSAELQDLADDLDSLTRHNLTNWEDEFVFSLQQRLEMYRGETLITDKQWEWIDRLCEKYEIY